MSKQKLIDYAISQIGVSEDPLGSNRQKYGKLIDSTNWYLYKEGTKEWIHKVNGYDWCTQFVDASFITTYGIDQARKMLYRPVYNNYGAGVSYAYNYYKKAGKAFQRGEKKPSAGDVIFFQNSKGISHTGIVIDVTDSSVITIEGNSGQNSMYVAKHTYKLIDSYIYGYGHPDYDEKPDPEYYHRGNVYTVSCTGPLRIRKGASTDTDIIDNLYRGDKVLCEDIVKDGSGNTWLKITGYTAAYYDGERWIT